MSEYYLNPNTPEPDFAYWAIMPEWSWLEAAALFCGLDPVEAPPDWWVPQDQQWKFDKLYRLTKRVGPYLGSIIRPAQWLDWAKKSDVPIPPELEQAVEKYGSAAVSAEHECITEKETRIAELTGGADGQPFGHTDNAQTVGARERESMLKIIIALAIKGYGFDPLPARSNQINDIVKDIKECGLILSDDTVRKYLREAAELLPPREGREP